MNKNYDTIIIGAGAAGLMCALTAGARGQSVAIIDHAKKLGEKIRISGGGRCNFTNLHASPAQYLSSNPHFVKSALRQYTQHDFINMVDRHAIAYHEKTLGQLFCDEKSQQIIDMLRQECDQAGVHIEMGCSVSTVEKSDNDTFIVQCDKGTITSRSLVIASGGLSIPKIGATSVGYKIAEQFGLNIIPVRAGLVPLTFQNDLLDFCKALSGVSVDAIVQCSKTSFREGLLFTHRGLSGPSILQISSYWKQGDSITINLCPDHDIATALKKAKKDSPKKQVPTVLSTLIPSRLAQAICEEEGLQDKRLADCPDKKLLHLSSRINSWQVKPSGTEGYHTAEVTLGGVDTAHLSSKTMETKTVKGLFFIGEVVDVTGHLGGYNFQWAWSSGYVAGQNV